MPYIDAKLSVSLTQQKEKEIKQKLGEAIECIPVKSEQWLMVQLEENCCLYFQGTNDQPSAMVEVKIFGKAEDSAYDAMTAAVTEILSSELEIPASRIYVKYEECSHWGWNGNNF